MANAKGLSVITETRPGAGGIIAAEVTARAAPDGYTMLMATAGLLAVNVSLYRKLPYDPANDFVPVTLTGRFVLTIAVNPSVLNVSSVKELIDAAKKEPGKINYASPGTGSGSATSRSRSSRCCRRATASCSPAACSSSCACAR